MRRAARPATTYSGSIGLAPVVTPLIVCRSGSTKSILARALAAGVGLLAAQSFQSGLDGSGFGAPLPMSDSMGLMAPLMFPHTGSSSHPAGMVFPKLSVLLFIRYNITQVRLFVKGFLKLLSILRVTYWLPCDTPTLETLG